MDALLQQLKDSFLSGDLFQSIKENFVIVYEVKSLLKKLNILIAPYAIFIFILEFRPLLDQITQYLQNKSDVEANMTSQDSVCSNEWYLDVESWSRVEELEAKINNTASYVIDILKWKQHIQEL